MSYFLTKVTLLRTTQPGLIPRAAGLFFLFLLIGVELLKILDINDGMFVYTLDDPYIHLALAENILRGHYGINLNEFSAPSSSVLWPFILAPVSWSPISPLILNTLCAIGVTLTFCNIIEFSTREIDTPYHEAIKSILLILFILCTNLVGLVFIGMEHTLQVFVVALIAYGLLLESRTSVVRRWLFPAIVLAPLVRYECLAISAAAILYLAVRGHRKPAAAAASLTISFLAGFSFFLLAHDLGYVPTSVDAKLIPLGEDATLFSILRTQMIIQLQRQGVIILVGGYIAYALLVISRYLGEESLRQILLLTVVAVLLHFLFGKTNWYNRYEIYLWTFLLINIFYAAARIFTIKRGSVISGKKSIALLTGLSCLLIIASWPYLTALTTIPLASTNVYQQQYQMSRFVSEYYQGPVAVNDIGYVSYKNDFYVLDFWGLASAESLQNRRDESDTQWMIGMLDERNIELVMMYDFLIAESQEGFLPLGELILGNERVTPAGDRVSFYATENSDIDTIQTLLGQFAQSLPENTEFIFR